MSAGAPAGWLVLGRRSRPLDAAEETLLGELERQAAAAVHAVRLIRELQASRAAIVVSREEERRRVRHELHEGLGQSLAAISLSFDAVRESLRTDPRAAAVALGATRAACDRAVASVRLVATRLATEVDGQREGRPGPAMPAPVPQPSEHALAAPTWARRIERDALVNRGLVFAAVTAAVLAVYVGVVGGSSVLAQALEPAGEDATAHASLLAAAIVAVLIGTLRARVQAGVDRLMFGERENPYRVLSRVATRIQAAVSPEDALPAAADAIAQALRIPYAAIELPDGRRIAAPGARPSARDPQRLPLVFQGEVVGALVLGPRSGGGAKPGVARGLLADLARSVAVAVHAARTRLDLERATVELAEAASLERRRLRRDLHDGLGPALAGIALQVDAAARLAPTDPARADAILRRTAAAGTAAIAEIRRIVYDLRPPALDELGLAAAIRRHAETLDEPAGEARATPLPRVAVEAPDPMPALPAAVEVAVFRIALEALTNVLRHAGAGRCTIRLSVDDGLRLEVVDDGRGLGPDLASGIGLVSMRERAAELGGWCRVEAGDAGGTRVLASLPLPVPAG